jgi:hypothetical protein
MFYNVPSVNREQIETFLTLRVLVCQAIRKPQSNRFSAFLNIASIIHLMGYVLSVLIQDCWRAITLYVYARRVLTIRVPMAYARIALQISMAA